MATARRMHSGTTVIDINVCYSSLFKYKFCEMLHNGRIYRQFVVVLRKRRVEYNSKIYYTLKYIL